MATELQLTVLRGIATNYFTGSANPVNAPVWSDCLDSTDEPNMPAGKRLSGAVSTLCQAGLLKKDGECIMITEAGMAAIG